MIVNMYSILACQSAPTLRFAQKSDSELSKVLTGRFWAHSSLSAMHGLTSETPPLRGSRYTEEDWNEDSTIENGQFYPLSKVQLRWEQNIHSAQKRPDCAVLQALLRRNIQPAISDERCFECNECKLLSSADDGQVLAEQAAWDYAKKENLDLVVINPVCDSLCAAAATNNVRAWC